MSSPAVCKTRKSVLSVGRDENTTSPSNAVSESRLLVETANFERACAASSVFEASLRSVRSPSNEENSSLSVTVPS